MLVSWNKGQTSLPKNHEREEKTLGVDIAGRFKAGKGEEGGGYQYLMVATFQAAKKKWGGRLEESHEDQQAQDKGKHEDQTEVAV